MEVLFHRGQRAGSTDTPPRFWIDYPAAFVLHLPSRTLLC
jgi:hypothetical protein